MERCRLCMLAGDKYLSSCALACWRYSSRSALRSCKQWLGASIRFPGLRQHYNLHQHSTVYDFSIESSDNMKPDSGLSCIAPPSRSRGFNHEESLAGRMKKLEQISSSGIHKGGREEGAA